MSTRTATQPGAVKITLHSANNDVDEKAEVTVALKHPEEAVAKMLKTLAQRFPPESVMTIQPSGGYGGGSSHESSAAAHEHMHSGGAHSGGAHSARSPTHSQQQQHYSNRIFDGADLLGPQEKQREDSPCTRTSSQAGSTTHQHRISGTKSGRSGRHHNGSYPHYPPNAAYPGPCSIDKSNQVARDESNNSLSQVPASPLHPNVHPGMVPMYPGGGYPAGATVFPGAAMFPGAPPMPFPGGPPMPFSGPYAWSPAHGAAGTAAPNAADAAQANAQFAGMWPPMMMPGGSFVHPYGYPPLGPPPPMIDASGKLVGPYPMGSAGSPAGDAWHGVYSPTYGYPTGAPAGAPAGAAAQQHQQQGRIPGSTGHLLPPASMKETDILGRGASEDRRESGVRPMRTDSRSHPDPMAVPLMPSNVSPQHIGGNTMIPVPNRPYSGLDVMGGLRPGFGEYVHVNNDGSRTRYVEVEVHEERQIEVPKVEVREVVKEVKEPRYETRVIEQEELVIDEEVIYQDRITEEEREVEVRVKKVQEVPVERIIQNHVDVHTTREQVVEVPEVIEVPKPYTVEQPVSVPRYVQREQPCMVAQKLRPSIRNEGKLTVPTTTYEPVLYAVDVYIPKPVANAIVANGKIDETHQRVNIPAAQYNSLTYKLNPMLEKQVVNEICLKTVEGHIPLLPAGELADIIPPMQGAWANPNQGAFATAIRDRGRGRTHSPHDRHKKSSHKKHRHQTRAR